MNKPDEHTLNRWLRGELKGEELRKIEAWADENVGDLDAEFKCNIGWNALGADFMKAIPTSEEPPYPEFFNSKIQQAIKADETDGVDYAPQQAQVVPSVWQKLVAMFIPAAIAAGVAFYAGSHFTQPATPSAGSSGGVSYERIYVPDTHVDVAFSETERATEIVLEGLNPISDELDIVKGETSFGESPTMMVVHPHKESEADPTMNQVTFF